MLIRCKECHFLENFSVFWKLWRKINLISWYIEVQNLLTSVILILEVSKKHHCKLYKILRNFCFEHNLWFSVVFEYYASICSVPVLIHKGFFLFWHYCTSYLQLWGWKLGHDIVLIETTLSASIFITVITMEQTTFRPSNRNKSIHV